MKKTKRSLALFLSLIVVCFFCGCNQGENSKTFDTDFDEFVSEFQKNFSGEFIAENEQSDRTGYVLDSESQTYLVVQYNPGTKKVSSLHITLPDGVNNSKETKQLFKEACLLCMEIINSYMDQVGFGNCIQAVLDGRSDFNYVDNSIANRRISQLSGNIYFALEQPEEE